MSSNCPAWMQEGVSTLQSLGFAIVAIADLKALEEAKTRYELAYAQDLDRIPSRAQEASAPVAQETEQKARSHPSAESDAEAEALVTQARTIAEQAQLIRNLYTLNESAKALVNTYYSIYGVAAP